MANFQYSIAATFLQVFPTTEILNRSKLLTVIGLSLAETPKKSLLGIPVTVHRIKSFRSWLCDLSSSRISERHDSLYAAGIEVMQPMLSIQ